MKPRLIILSDLWGVQKSDWIETYTKYLSEKFVLKYYDCCQLGEVDISNYKKDVLHRQFIQSGIEAAVQRLLTLEKGKITILAFSIGGAIAWKAGLEGLKIENLFLVSSTRLRFEIEKPNAHVKVYFGSEDEFKPKIDWYTALNTSNKIFRNQNHEFYKNEEFAIEICRDLNKPKF